MALKPPKTQAFSVGIQGFDLKNLRDTTAWSHFVRGGGRLATGLWHTSLYRSGGLWCAGAVPFCARVWDGCLVVGMVGGLLSMQQCMPDMTFFCFASQNKKPRVMVS